MRILLKAYTQLNLGDDLFLHIISRRYPDAEFVLASEVGHRYDGFIASHPNITAFAHHGFAYRVLRKIGHTPYIDKMLFRNIDAVVYIGGSIFMENKSNRFYEKQLTAEVDYCKKRNIPYHIISCNFGPYFTDGYVQRMRRCFKKCDEVCFRDKYSYNLFSDIPSVRYAPDAAFSYDIERPEVREGVLGISLINYEKRNRAKTEEYMYTLKQTVREHIIGGGRAELFCFCKSEGDCDAAEILRDSLGNSEKISIIEYDGDIMEFAKRFISCEKVFATRFHAVVLALIHNVPMIPYIYSGKTENLLRDLGIYEKIDTQKYTPYNPNGDLVKCSKEIWQKIDDLCGNF